MDPQAHPRPARGLENRAGFADGEDALFAEDVAIARELLPRGAGHDLVGHDAHPLAAVARELGRNFVRGEQRRHQAREAGVPAELPEQDEGADLVLLRQAVAGLGLGGRRPVGEHPGKPPADGPFELRVRAGARRADRGVDAAALGRDRGVALSREPSADLGAPIAQPDRMRVRVDESRDDGASARVQGLSRGASGELARVVLLGAHEYDSPVLRPNGRVPQPQDLALGLTPPRFASDRRREAADVADLEGGHARPIKSRAAFFGACSPRVPRASRGCTERPHSASSSRASRGSGLRFSELRG